MANRLPLRQQSSTTFFNKKQGVSAESSDTTHQPADIAIVKHEKDFRYSHSPNERNVVNRTAHFQVQAAHQRRHLGQRLPEELGPLAGEGAGRLHVPQRVPDGFVRDKGRRGGGALVRLRGGRVRSYQRQQGPGQNGFVQGVRGTRRSVQLHQDGVHKR